MPLSRRYAYSYTYPASVARETDQVLRTAWRQDRLSVGSAEQAALVEPGWPWHRQPRALRWRIISAACRRMLDNPIVRSAK
jgi:hypothetical protein